jgi:cystathionine beta-lyase/cystathionine gamma-synthase
MTAGTLATLAIHADRAGPALWPRGISTPIFQSSTFELDGAAYADIEQTGGKRTWWYTRLANPTVDGVARTLAALEGAEEALLFSSGMSAISTTLLALVPPGGRVVAGRGVYGGTHVLLERFADFGREAALVDVDDHAAWHRESASGADVLYVETLSNPLLRVADLPALARLARSNGALLVVDSTFTTPVNVRPVEHGADIVLHSATKYLNGHCDLVAGAVAGRSDLVDRVHERAITLGGCLDPHAAFLLGRGLRTLVLRMERHNANAAIVAAWLERHPDVEAVSYPFLDSHPDYALAHRLLAGASGVVTFRVRGGDERAGRLLDRLHLFRQAISLGGVESLASAPYNTSHAVLSSQERGRAGILPGTVRLSVGIEDVDDLLADLDEALARTTVAVEATH